MSRTRLDAGRSRAYVGGMAHMLVWTLRRWPKAQYLAQALQIPPAAWDIPFLFAPIGGPEITMFEAYDRPELGALTPRLKALSRPLCEAALRDHWAKETLFTGDKCAVAFLPGVALDQLAAQCTQDGYEVHALDEVLGARPPFEGAWAEEGLHDRFGSILAGWRAEDLEEDEILRRTLALPDWVNGYHSGAFYLVRRLSDLPRMVELADDPAAAVEGLAHLALHDLAHASLVAPFLAMERPDLLSEAARRWMGVLDPRRAASLPTAG